MRLILIGIAMLTLLVVGLFGLRGSLSRKPPLEVFPDMDRQPKLRPMEPNRFFANGISSQPLVEGTVARSKPVTDLAGQKVHPFQVDHPVNSGRVAGSTNYLELTPLSVSREVVARGRERYGISCVPCHGDLGDGQGMVTRLGVGMAAANLHDPTIVRMTDGQLYRTVSFGSKEGAGVMKGYAANVDVADRWAIVAYVRALQSSKLASLDELKVHEAAKPGTVPAALFQPLKN